MDWRSHAGWFVFLLVFSLASGSASELDGVLDSPLPTPIEDEESQRAFPWSTEDIAGDIGSFSHVAVAANAVTGSVFIAYYDAVNGDLMWARTVSSGGNCGPANAWLCEQLFTQGDVGRYCSIAIHPVPGGVDITIPFYDATNERLGYFTGNVTGDVATGFLRVLDSGFAASDRTGMYTAVQYDSNGNPWIAYQNETYDAMVGTHRMVARWVGDGSGNCGEGAVAGDWECGDLFANGFAQTFSSTSMVIDSLDRPVVAFYDEHLGLPVVAYYVGAGGSCGPFNTWRSYNVPPRPGDSDAGRHVVPFVADGSLTLFYQNSYREQLERAVYVYPTAGNCGFSGSTMSYEWQCESINNMDGSPARGISVVGDGLGYPIVAYQFGEEPGPAVLRVARPVASPEVDVTGNCGVGNTWYCETVDGGAYRTEASSVSLAADQRGDRFLAYHEWDDYYYEHNLKLATQAAEAIFGDGFERGNTSGWSTTAP